MQKAGKLIISERYSRLLVQKLSSHFQVSDIKPEKPGYLFGSLVHDAHKNSFFSAFYSNARNLRHGFSSQAVLASVDPPQTRDQDVLNTQLTEIVLRSKWSKETETELKTLNFSLNEGHVMHVLKNLKGNPRSAIEFFNWALEAMDGKLSSETYNSIIVILGKKGSTTEFWGLIKTMRKEGQNIQEEAYKVILKNFDEAKLAKDAEKLKKLFLSEPESSSCDAKICTQILRIVNECDWSEEASKKLGSLDISLSDEMVVRILERLSASPIKALNFFRWVSQELSFKHGENTYNAVIVLLGREDYINKFWDLVKEMKQEGYGIQMGTYAKLSRRFSKRKMINEAVDLYVYTMKSPNKPSDHDFSMLLRTLALNIEQGLNLFPRAIKAFEDSGHSVSKSSVDGVLKALASIGKLSEADKILKAISASGLQAHVNFQNLVISVLCRAGDLEKASKIFLWVAEKQGKADAATLELLVNKYCDLKRAGDAFTFIKKVVENTGIKPWHTTYKTLVEKLIGQNRIGDALKLLGLMKCHGFPPFTDPFFEYIPKSGTVDDAVGLFEAITVKNLPSTSVIIRMFEAFLKAGRFNVAHDLLSRSPGHIRNHADILNLFCAMKPQGAAA
ncbi:hypothetical protein AMTRI_Chr10g7720 [Amborella trichopoda]